MGLLFRYFDKFNNELLLNKISNIKDNDYKFLLITGFFIFRVIYKIFKPIREFIIDGERFPYLYHSRTWMTERTVEVPLIWEFVKKTKGSILEIGNVLHWYYTIHHDVLDKYDVEYGYVINKDVVEFVPKEKYDLIVSISTLEHVGFDEEKLDPNKVLIALDNIRENCLKPKGILIVTIPLGYNKYLDNLIKKGLFSFKKQLILKRISISNKWEEQSNFTFSEIKYNRPFPKANWLFIGIDS